MIRSPPPKAANRAPAQTVVDPPSRSSSSLDASTSHPTGVTPTLGARSPRPEDARFAYLNAQLENLISERNAARKDATVAKEEKNLALRENRQLNSEEKRDWVELCETIQAIHDLSRLRVQLEMDEERLRIFTDYEQPLRELKIAALMRDHKLAQFQNQEYWMKEEMDELKEERRLSLVNNRTEIGLVQDQADASLREVRAQLDASESSRQALLAKLAHLRRKNDDLEGELDRTRVAHEALESKLTDVSAKLERAELNLGSAKQDLAEKNEEIKKWHKLDKREDRELEELRKVKVDLEIKVQELEDRVQDDALKIKKGKVDRKELLSSKEEIAQLESELGNARETIDRLQEAAKSRPQPHKPSRNVTSKKTQSKAQSAMESDDDKVQHQNVDDESASEVTPPRKPKKTSKKPARKAPSVKPVTSDDEVAESDQDARDSERESSVPPPPKPKTQPKPKPRPRRVSKDTTAKPASKQTKTQRPIVNVETDDEEEEEERPVKPSRTALGKRTARDEEEQPSAPRGTKKTSDVSRRPAPVEAESEPKKKRIRKLGGVLGTDNMPTFDWGSSDVGGIGIPGMLSPLDPRRVPPRSLSGSGPSRLR